MRNVAPYKVLFLLLLLIGGIGFGCTPEPEDSEELDEVEMSGGRSGGVDAAAASEGCLPVNRNINEKFGNNPVNLRPEEARYRGDVLVLSAWGDVSDTWCHRSSFCSTAQEMGYRLIFPAMGKSIYTSQHYPETRPDWQSFPTYTWLRDTLIPGLQNKYCLLSEDGNNFIVGMSAGARGAVRLLEDMPDLFVAAAALSGDYDPGQMKGDNIYRGFLGSYDQFEERWKVTENLVSRASDIQTPLYLGHGKNDPLVPYVQTEQLYAAITDANPQLRLQLHLAEEQMDGYEYWNSEILPILEFFGGSQANHPETP